MKQVDPVMQQVWHAKELNAKTHKNLATYIAFLRKQPKRKTAVSPASGHRRAKGTVAS